MTEPAPKKFETLDDIFGAPNVPAGEMSGSVVEIPDELIDDFPDHPFKVRMDDAMKDLTESIQEHGVLVPALLRPRPNGRYEMIAGHRRRVGNRMAERLTLPAIVRDYTDDEAIIIMVDSNIQRENIPHSEKAHAYKMKMDAIERQLGRPPKENGGQLGHHLDFKGKTRDFLAEDSKDSARTIQRYIQLTHLIPELLEMVDDKRISFNAGVELSDLTEAEQHFVLQTIESEEATPSIAQANDLKKLSGKLSEDDVFTIMSKPKPNQVERVKIERNRISEYLPPKATDKEVQDIICEALKDWYKKQQRRRTEAR